MSEIFGTNERLIIEDAPDSDGELEVYMPIDGGDNGEVFTWLNKEDAIRLMTHLQNAFGI